MTDEEILNCYRKSCGQITTFAAEIIKLERERCAALESENAALKSIVREHIAAVDAEAKARWSYQVAIDNFSDHEMEAREWMKQIMLVSEIDARLRLAIEQKS